MVPKQMKMLSEKAHKIFNFIDCMLERGLTMFVNCQTIYDAGYIKYVIETNDYRNTDLMANLKGTQSLIIFYQLNKAVIGDLDYMNKLSKLEEENKLKAYIEKMIK